MLWFVIILLSYPKPQPAWGEFSFSAPKYQKKSLVKHPNQKDRFPRLSTMATPMKSHLSGLYSNGKSHPKMNDDWGYPIFLVQQKPAGSSDRAAARCSADLSSGFHRPSVPGRGHHRTCGAFRWRPKSGIGNCWDLMGHKTHQNIIQNWANDDEASQITKQKASLV